MKRDMDLMREILFEVEKWRYTGGFDTVVIPNRSQEEISYHVYLLADAGLIEAVNGSDHSEVRWYPKHLTNAGHEFLNAARDQTRWGKAKDTVFKNTGTLTLEALKIALGLLMKHAITGGM